MGTGLRDRASGGGGTGFGGGGDRVWGGGGTGFGGGAQGLGDWVVGVRMQVIR